MISRASRPLPTKSAIAAPGQPCGPWLKWLKVQSCAAPPSSHSSGAKRSANSTRSGSRWLKVFEIRIWLPAGITAPFQPTSRSVSRDSSGVVG